jgi:hypothetical protein
LTCYEASPIETKKFSLAQLNSSKAMHAKKQWKKGKMPRCKCYPIGTFRLCYSDNAHVDSYNTST